MAARQDAKYSRKSSEKICLNTSRAQTLLGQQALAQTAPGRKWRGVNHTALPPTSNCQWAAWRSCFAWSAAQPAVKTNWLIMTWCLSSSIFTDMTAFYSTRSRSKVEYKTKKSENVVWDDTSEPSDPVLPRSQTPESPPQPSAATIIFLCHH